MGALNILALNSGSSSLKFGLYRAGPAEVQTLFSDKVDVPGASTQREAIAGIAARLSDAKMPAPDAIGHRIVHGGPKLLQHCVIDESVLRQLEAAAQFAPLHIPPSLAIIRYAGQHFPGLPQIACFDTAFHAAMPDVARVLPIPREMRSEGIHRYGFHGLSCESILHQLGDEVPDRIIIAHLGNGASVSAVKGSKSIDTSMGLTPTGGVIMGTRSGDLDPGVLIYLMREKKYDAAMLETLVDRHSGLSGISGIGGDMRTLHNAAPSNDNARLALRMFSYSVCKQIAAMIAALDGVDLIVFTGGIGENDAKIRAAICAGLSWIGIILDEARNQASAGLISGPASRCAVRVFPSREDEQIARHSWVLLRPHIG